MHQKYWVLNVRHAIRNPWVLTVALLGLLCACSRSKTPRGKVSAGPEFGQVGNILLGKSPQRSSGPKVIVASFTFTAQGVSPGPVVASIGSPTISRFSTGDYEMRLVSASGEKLVSFPIPNPRAVIVEHQGIVLEDSTVYAARFPFRADAAAVRVFDKAGRQLAEASVAAVVREFCSRLKDDPDCKSLPRSPAK